MDSCVKVYEVYLYELYGEVFSFSFLGLCWGCS